MWVIFTIFALTFISGIYVTEQVLPKWYSATATIRIQGEVHNLKGMLPDMDRPIDNTEFQNEYETMHSSKVLLPIIKSLGLDKTWAKRVYKLSADTALPDQDALAYMNSNLAIVYTHGTNMVNITARSQVPQEAKDIANALVASYKKLRDDDQAQKSGVGVETLRDQIADQQKVVDDAKAKRDQLRTDLGIIYTSGSGSSGPLGPDIQSQELEARQKDLLTAQQDLDKRQVLFDSTKGLSDAQFVSTLEGMQQAPANMATLQSEILGLEGSVDNLLKQGFDSQHPRVLALQAELSRKRDQFTTLIAGSRNALDINVKMAKSGVALLQKKVDDLKAANIEEQNKHVGPFTDAEREFQKQQSLLDSFNIRLKENVNDTHLLESPVKVITDADLPLYPSSPNVPLFIGLSALIGIFTGVVVAFLIEYLDTSVKTMADAEQLLGLPVLTIVPNKGGPMPLTQQTARLPHAEAYRILRAKLDLKVQNGLGPSVTMLSGGPGEGKSTTIYNLAIVCAQAGQSVILVDGDLRRPTLHDLLHVSNEHGVSNYLRNEGDAIDYIQQTDLPKLHVLTAGETPISEIGNFSGEKIRAMIDELKQRYDLVLIDSPPVLGISDGSIIARETDYVILVIQHRRYPREISLRAKRAIEEVHGNCVGMVLNAVAVKSDDSYYYYSNYGNYYAKADRKKRRKKKLNGAGEPEVKTVRIGDLNNGEF